MAEEGDVKVDLEDPRTDSKTALQAEMGNAEVLKAEMSPEERAEEESKNRVAIIQGLLNGRTCWYGSWWADYRFHVMQTHPLFSLFLCHQLHPFSSIKRIVVFTVLALLALGTSGVLKEAHVAGKAMVFGLSVVLSIQTEIISYQLKYMLICPCLQEGSTSCWARCCGIVIRCFSVCRTVDVCMIVCTAVVWFALGISLAHFASADSKVDDVFYSWMVSLVQTNLITFFVVSLVMFWMYYSPEPDTPEAYAKKRGQYPQPGYPTKEFLDLGDRSPWFWKRPHEALPWCFKEDKSAAKDEPGATTLGQPPPDKE